MAVLKLAASQSHQQIWLFLEMFNTKITTNQYTTYSCIHILHVYNYYTWTMYILHIKNIYCGLCFARYKNRKIWLSNILFHKFISCNYAMYAFRKIEVTHTLVLNNSGWYSISDTCTQEETRIENGSGVGWCWKRKERRWSQHDAH